MTKTLHEKAMDANFRSSRAQDAENSARRAKEHALREEAVLIARNLDRTDEAGMAMITPGLAVAIGEVLPDIVRARCDRLAELQKAIGKHMENGTQKRDAQAILAWEYARQLKGVGD